MHFTTESANAMSVDDVLQVLYHFDGTFEVQKNQAYAIKRLPCQPFALVVVHPHQDEGAH